jgi:Uma2 family endonuclease
MGQSHLTYPLAIFCHNKPMVVQDKTRLSFGDFLEQEAKAEFRSEYHDGESRPMAGGTTEHNQIALNLSSPLIVAFRGQPHRVFMNDVALWIPSYRKSTYPDLMIVDGEIKRLETRFNVILNPTVIIEVLSESTEGYDRGDKFKLYRSLPSFREYILISQTMIHVDQFVKTEDGHWLLTDYDGEDGVLKLKTVPFEVTLKDLYDKVTLVEVSGPMEE